MNDGDAVKTDGTAKRYRELAAWQKAYKLVLEAYRVTSQFPSEERFGLVQQMRRAAMSIPCNIAEGWGRASRIDYLRFLDMARGSNNELQTQLWIAADLGFVEKDHAIHDLVDEVGRIISGLIRSLRRPASSVSQALDPRP